MTESGSDDRDRVWLEMLSQAEFDCNRRVNRIIERHAKVHGDRIERLWELLGQRNRVREILTRSEAEWPQWQTGLQSVDRHQFLMGVLAEISEVVFDDRSPTEVAAEAGMPVGLCGNRDDHEPHLHHSWSLGKFWCSADQATRLPYAAERRNKTDQRNRE